MKINKPIYSANRFRTRESISLLLLGALAVCTNLKGQSDSTGKSQGNGVSSLHDPNNPLFLDSERIERVEVNGDPKVGTVTIIQQLHETPDMDEVQRIHVGEIQFQILQELKRLGVKDIFLEGRFVEFSCGNDDDRDSMDQVILRSTVRNHFMDNSYTCTDEALEDYCLEEENLDKPDCDPNSIYEDRFFDNIEELKKGDKCAQKQYKEKMELVAQGAGKIYACLGEAGIRVHRLLEGDLGDKLKQWVTEGPQDGEGYDEWLEKLKSLTPKREKNAVAKIMAFLAEEGHKGKHVVLIYGAAHNFKDDFEKLETPPLVHLITFPNAIRENYKAITGEELTGNGL